MKEETVKKALELINKISTLKQRVARIEGQIEIIDRITHHGGRQQMCLAVTKITDTDVGLPSELTELRLSLGDIAAVLVERRKYAQAGQMDLERRLEEL